MNRNKLLEIIENHYKSISRDKYPNMDSYSIKDLLKVIEIFNLF